jgi:CheY-like chemotaxis protein
VAHLDVFLIDDDRIYQFTARKTLESTGMVKDLQIFSNGEEAIDYLKAHPGKLPHLIFLDINMPTMDGWQFLEACTQYIQPGQLVIYMVSSSVDEYDIRKSKEYSLVSDYIIKPISRDKFEFLLKTL